MYQEIQTISKDIKEDMIRFAQKLIQTPSLSGDEKAVADVYLDEMNRLGYDRVFRDHWGNVIGVIRGTEPGPTIMYNAHLDHVDTGDLNEWEHDPYKAVRDISLMYNQEQENLEEVEVIHGRAASDTKGGGACQVYSGYVLIKLRERGHKIKGNYIFTGVVLEEPAEQAGMIKLMEETLPEKGVIIDAVVSCEASSLKLNLGHRGRVEIKVTILGTTSHASAPWLGKNAVNKATKFIDKVEETVAAQIKIDKELGKSTIALTIINCSPGTLCIIPDRVNITYDRRFVPEETAETCVQQIQDIIDEMSKNDPDFSATVEVAEVPRKTYTGETICFPNVKQAWKIEKNHPLVRAAAKGLQAVNQPVKYGYWDFGTDLSIVAGKYKIPAFGYSPMQEFYVHRSIDKVRIDYMEKALIGNVSIFLQITQLEKEHFKI